MSFEAVSEAFTQLEHDQSLFEAELGTELQGYHHEELVQLGTEMIIRVREFIQMGKVFAEQQSPEILTNMAYAIHEYEDLLMPAKLFGGMCPCIKPARHGPDYDRQFVACRVKVVSTIFIAHAIIIENKAEKINMDSVHFADYTNKLNAIFNMLSSISTKGDDKARENAKAELMKAVEVVHRFLRSFDEETEDFRAESKRRISSINELLSVRSNDNQLPVSRRILVKCQSSLQEIMNSSAAVSMGKAREALVTLEALSSELKSIKMDQVQRFSEQEDKLASYNMMGKLHKLRDEIELVHSDTNSKIRDSMKRWNIVKSQSAPRPVVEYTDDGASGHNTPIRDNINNIITTTPETTKNMFFDTGKNLEQKFINLGKDFKQLGAITVKGGGAVVSGTVNGLGNVVDNGVGLVSTGASKTAKVFDSAAKRTVQHLGLEAESPKAKYTGGKSLSAGSNGSYSSHGFGMNSNSSNGHGTPNSQTGLSKLSSALFDF
jgi:hypothetical protein